MRSLPLSLCLTQAKTCCLGTTLTAHCLCYLRQTGPVQCKTDKSVRDWGTISVFAVGWFITVSCGPWLTTDSVSVFWWEVGVYPLKSRRWDCGRWREMILYGSDSADYQKTHHNIYRDGSVSYSTLSVQGLHTNGADHRNQTNVLKKN